MFFAYNVFPCRILRGKKTSSTHWLQERKKGRKKEKLHFNICCDLSRTFLGRQPPLSDAERKKSIYISTSAQQTFWFSLKLAALLFDPRPSSTRRRITANSGSFIVYSIVEAHQASIQETPSSEQSVAVCDNKIYQRTDSCKLIL